MDVSDDFSGIDYSYLNVTDSDGNDVDSTTGTSLDLSSLDNEEFTVNYYIKDNAGNWENSSWSFTVDTSYDGASSVDFEYDDDYIYLMEDDSDDLDFNVDLGDSADEDSDIRLTCYAGSVDEDNEFDQTDYESVDDEGYEYSCSLPGDEYSDQSVDVVVEACDAAGNCEEVGETTYRMDLSEPYITDFGHPEDLSTFNSGFEVEFDAGDAATSVSQVEYFFDDSSLTYGDGTEIENFDDTPVEIDPSGLDSGEHTLYIRAKDEAGRWNDAQSFEFEYYPDQTPEVSLSVPDRMEVTAGETEEFEVTADNTGEFLIESVNLNVSSPLSGEESISGFEPGDSLTLTFEASPSESEIGEYDVEVSTDSPSTSQSFTYRVKANQQQREQVQSRLDEQVQRLEELEANVTSLQQKVSDRQSEALSANLSEFKADVEQAQNAVENGEYYAAQEALDGIDGDYSTAQTAYEDIRQEYQSSQRFKMILAVVGLILLGGIGGIGYLVHEGRIDPEELMQQLQEKAGDVDMDTGGESSGPGIMKKIKLMLEGNESEAEEFEWDGFKDQ